MNDSAVAGLRSRAGLRRMASLAVAVVTALASLATSPPSEPLATVSSTLRGSVSLSVEQPVATVPLRVVASDEALWSDDREVRVESALVDFRAPYPRQFPPPSGPPTPQPPEVRLAVISVATGTAIPASAPRWTSVDLLRLCPEFRTCELELRLVLELIDELPPGEQHAIEWQAEGVTRIRGPEQPPLHANISIARAGSEPSVPSVVLAEEATEAGIRLDPENPLAIRRVRVRLAGDIASTPLNWPIEPRAVLTTEFHPVAEVARSDRDPVARFTIIPEEGLAQQSPSTMLAGANTNVPVFEGCAGRDPCEATFTLRFEWMSTSSVLGGDVDWRFSAGLLYHDGRSPGADDRVSVEVEDLGSAGPEDAALTAATNGQIILTREDGATTVWDTFTVRLNAAAVSEQDFGVAPPSVHARFVLQLGGRELPEELGGVRINCLIRPAETCAGLPHYFEDPTIERLLVLISDCTPGEECERQVQLGIAVSPIDLGKLSETAVIEVDWSVELRMVYPDRAEAPSGATLQIE